MIGFKANHSLFSLIPSLSHGHNSFTPVRKVLRVSVHRCIKMRTNLDTCSRSNSTLTLTEPSQHNLHSTLWTLDNCFSSTYTTLDRIRYGKVSVGGSVSQQFSSTLPSGPSGSTARSSHATSFATNVLCNYGIEPFAGSSDVQRNSSRCGLWYGHSTALDCP